MVSALSLAHPLLISLSLSLSSVTDTARNLMHGIIPTMMFLFGMLVTFIGIFLQFAAKRTTAHVNSLVCDL